MERSMTPTLSIHGPTKTVRREPVLWSILFTRFCLTFLKISVAITYAFMGEICYREKVTLSTYIKDRDTLPQRLRAGGLILVGIKTWSLFQAQQPEILTLSPEEGDAYSCSSCPSVTLISRSAQ